MREAGPQCSGGYEEAAPLRPGLQPRFFHGLAWHWFTKRGQTLRPPGGPGRAGHGGSTQLTPVLGMGKLFETPQKAEAAQPLPPTAPHLLGAGLTGPEAALRCWEL